MPDDRADLAGSVLEHAVAAVQRGSLDQRSMLWTLAASVLYLPSLTEPTSDSMVAIEPLVLVAADGQELLALFTSAELAGDYVPSYPYVNVRTGSEIVRSMPDGIGFVVNPAGPVGFELRPPDIAALREEITA